MKEIGFLITWTVPLFVFSLNFIFGLKDIVFSLSAKQVIIDARTIISNHFLESNQTASGQALHSFLNDTVSSKTLFTIFFCKYVQWCVGVYLTLLPYKASQPEVTDISPRGNNNTVSEDQKT